LGFFHSHGKIYEFFEQDAKRKKQLQNKRKSVNYPKKEGEQLYEPIENHRMLFFDHPFGFGV